MKIFLSSLRSKGAGVFFMFGLGLLLGWPAAGYAAAPAGLSLSEAMTDALRNNLQIRLARERVEEAKGRYKQTSSYMFPHLSVNASDEKTFRKNLAAEGFASAGVIGPYDTFKAHLQLTQRVFDLSSIQRLRAGGADLKAAGFEGNLANRQIRVNAALAYLRNLDMQEERKAVEESLRLAQDMRTLAEHQKQAGLATSIDVVRARTHEAEQKAKLEQVLYDEKEASLELKRIAGLPLATSLDLTGTLAFDATGTLPLKEALQTAQKNRLEMKIAQAEVAMHRYQWKAAKNQRYPKLNLTGQYGYTGQTPRKMRTDTGSVLLEFSLPLFEGGRIQGEMQEAFSRLQQEKLKEKDMAAQIEEDVRLAFFSLNSSTAKVKAAENFITLARQEVRLADKRFKSGANDNIELLNAQTTLEQARDTYVASLVQYETARLNYYSAIGRMKDFQL